MSFNKSVLLCLTFASAALCLSVSDYNTILEAVEDSFRGLPLMQPKALRLAFHDCPTKCDGCLNMTDASNNGLQPIIDHLEGLYPTYGSPYGLSRADFWALAGIASVTKGITVSNRQCNAADPILSCTTMPALSTTFRTGREDCNGAPYQTSGDQREFPNPRMTASEMYAYYARTDGPGFGFTPHEVCALMGAHTMGSMTRDNSGHVGPWMVNRTIQFNNQFFQAMFSDKLTWTNVNPSRRNEDARYQFRAADSTGNTYANFLNTDFGCLYEFNFDSDFLTDCDVSAANTDCAHSATYSKAAQYRDDATLWMQDFSAVFEKMIENGYDSLTDLTT